MTVGFFRKWTSPERGDTASSVVFQYLDANRGYAVIDGFIPNGILSNTTGNSEISLSFASGTHRIVLTPEPVADFRADGKVTSGHRFRLVFDTHLPNGTYQAELSLSGEPTRKITIALGHCFPLTFRYRFQRLRLPDGRYLKFFRNGTFKVFCSSLFNRAAAEILLWAELIKNRTLPEWIAAATRFCFVFWRPFHRGRYWIFSDKLSNPIDSAFSIANSLVSNPEFSENRITPFYLTDGRHSLRVSMPSGLKTLRHLSLRHRLYFMAAEASVTSEGGYAPFSPPTSYADITAWQLRISALHGLVHHDLSAIYGRDFNNFNLMITGVEREAAYERGGLWGYRPEDVVRTGLPRWDARENEPKKKIYFGFTWRKNLVESVDKNTGVRNFGSMLSNSEYIRRIKSLLTNQRLIDLASGNGYMLEFLPHPILRDAIGIFNLPDGVHVVPEETPYESIYRDASVFITDYSSVAMDMAYLGKPVIYYQFDHDEFYANQGYTESYFSWEKDGFGLVSTEESDVISEISRLIARECTREDKYEKRAATFFPPRDKGNGFRACRAIFDKIQRCRA